MQLKKPKLSGLKTLAAPVGASGPAGFMLRTLPGSRSSSSSLAVQHRNRCQVPAVISAENSHLSERIAKPGGGA